MIRTALPNDTLYLIFTFPIKFFCLENKQPSSKQNQVPNYLKPARKLLRENKHHCKRNHEIAEFEKFLNPTIILFKK